jgi:magnesium chelatase family protein
VCRCPQERILKYRAQVSGPLLDRIDLHVTLAAEKAWHELPVGESSEAVRVRVLAARRRQLQRQDCLNAQLGATGLLANVQLDDAARALLAEAIHRLGWSARASQRALRVARTLADLDGLEQPRLEHVAQAVQFRPSSDDVGA